MKPWLAVLVGLVIGAPACGRRAAPPRVQLFTITRGSTCLVEYACAPGQACPAPYEYECGYTMWPTGYTDTATLPLARVGDTCYLRKRDCVSARCLTRTWQCPPPPPKGPLPIVAWTVTRGAAGCTARPEPRNRLTAAPPPFPIPCVAAYPAGVTTVERDPDTGGCVIPDEPCPEGAHCEPAEDTPVTCPEPAGR